jgi:mannose/fructose/sorbose-specific phosphotransferase system IIA component
LIGILIISHGNLSEALLESAKMFVTNTEDVKALAFYPGQGVEDLIHSTKAAIAGLVSNDGVLALVDLPGGSPARAAGTLILETERLETVSGVNLPMLVEVLMLRESMSLQELADYAAESGKEGIVDVGKLLRGGDS